MTNVGGRPRKEVDWNLIDDLCSIHCTGEEIAAILKVDYDTLNARCKEQHGEGFSDYYKKACVDGKRSLRRKQFEQAMSGNVPMLIWLGKNILGQADTPQVESKDIPPIQIFLNRDDTDKATD